MSSILFSLEWIGINKHMVHILCVLLLGQNFLLPKTTFIWNTLNETISLTVNAYITAMSYFSFPICSLAFSMGITDKTSRVLV